ncbi:MAG: hypothetical protein AAGC53_01590 [Actinomycetota bacterium]
MPGYGTVDHDYGLTLATTDPADDGPVWMVNLMKYRDRAVYADGTDGGRSGLEADNEYTPTEALAGVGARIVYAADVEATPLGDGTQWDRVAIVKYPTRRAFIAMQERKDFQDKHVHKEAGMERTFVIGCQPMALDGLREMESTSIPWDEVEHPPNDEDGVLHVLHVIKWNDGGREQMEGYHDKAFAVAAKHGARVAGWFDVEGTIVGDGRTWDQVRFNEFPSLREFMEVVNDPDRLAGQKDHREPAMADTYTLFCRPMIDELRND